MSAKQHTKKTKARKQNNRKNTRVQATQTLPRSVGLILPDQYDTKLRYTELISVVMAVNNWTSVRYTPTSAYDVNPLLASTAMAGFAELAALYKYYQVTMSSIKVEFFNSSATEILTVCVLPVVEDPGAAPLLAAVLSSREQPYSKTKTVSYIGGPKAVVVNSMSSQKMWGTPMAKTDLQFASLTNNVPSQNWHWWINLHAAGVIPTSVKAYVSIDVSIKFWNRFFLDR
jgi:hypothetical protein